MINEQLKAKIIGYFAALSDQIELRAQQLLLTMPDYDDAREEIIEKRRMLVEELRTAELLDLKALEDLTQAEYIKVKAVEDRLNEKLFRSFCFVLEPGSVDGAKIEPASAAVATDTRRFGHLITVDRYLNASALASFKALLSHYNCKAELQSRNCFFNLKSKVLLIYMFLDTYSF